MLTSTSRMLTVPGQARLAGPSARPSNIRTPVVCRSKVPPRVDAAILEEAPVALDVEDYINSLELADFSAFSSTTRHEALSPFGLFLAATPPPDYSKGGFVDKASAVAFLPSVPDSTKEDVLNSLLLAQLAATKKFDPYQQTDEWYGIYTTVLGQLGYVITDLNFDRFNTSAQGFTMDSVVVELLAAVASPDELQAASAILDALGKLSDDDGRLRLFSSSSASNGKGNFQVSTCTMNGTIAQLALGCFHFTASQSSTKVLWFDYSSSSTSFFKATQTVLFNLDQYGRVRDTVKNKLGSAANDFVSGLDI